MLLGVIADDFTGASDIANTLARGGMATTQFVGLQKAAAPAGCEAGVVSLKSRSTPVAEAVRDSLAALEWLRAQGCKQFVFKYCSTFDSTPQGNIGPVGEALAELLGAKGVVACPAFPATGRTIFQGHLFVGDKLLSESPLRHHPLNPMTDADLRRWLRLQTKTNVGWVPQATVAKGGAAVREALAAAGARGETLVIVDAVSEADLHAIGEACAGVPLVTGGSGIALGLPKNFAKAGALASSKATVRNVAGAAAILSGSCSAQTLKQVAHHLQSNPGMAIDPEDVLEGRVTPAQVADFAGRHPGKAPLAYSSAPPEAVAAVQQKRGREHAAQAIENFFGESARLLRERGVQRLVIAGGETSGAVVTALGLQAFDIGPEIDPGVPVLYAEGRALALKSGNFGSVDFFEKALSLMEKGEAPR